MTFPKDHDANENYPRVSDLLTLDVLLVTLLVVFLVIAGLVWLRA